MWWDCASSVPASYPTVRRLLSSPNHNQQEYIFQEHLTTVKVTTIEEARQVPYSTLMAGNAEVVLQPGYCTNTYGPFVGGLLVPRVPGKLLFQGACDENVKVMVGHNSTEGIFFTDPWATNIGSSDPSIVALC